MKVAMKCSAVVVAVATLAWAPGPVAAARTSAEEEAAVTPIQKVIELMIELQGKVVRESEVAQSQYEDFSKWCAKTSMEHKHELEGEEEKKEELEAAIAKSDSDADKFSMTIQDLSGAIATDESDLKAANLIRVKEHADFEKVDKELVDTIDTITRTVQVLKKEAGAAFLQRKEALPQSLVAVVGALGELVQAGSIFTAA